jgi:hypothetical protein
MDSTVSEEVKKCQELYQGRLPDRDNAKGGKFLLSTRSRPGDEGVDIYFADTLLADWNIGIDEALQEFCPLFIISRNHKGIMAKEYTFEQSTFFDKSSLSLPSFADTLKKWRNSLLNKYDQLTEEEALNKINTTYRNEWIARLKLSPDALGEAKITGTQTVNGHAALSYTIEGLPTEGGVVYWILDNSSNVETSDKEGEKTIAEAYRKNYGKDLQPPINPETIDPVF